MPDKKPAAFHLFLLINYDTFSTLRSSWMTMLEARRQNASLKSINVSKRWIKIPNLPGKTHV